MLIGYSTFWWIVVVYCRACLVNELSFHQIFLPWTRHPGRRGFEICLSTLVWDLSIGLWLWSHTSFPYAETVKPSALLQLSVALRRTPELTFKVSKLLLRFLASHSAVVESLIISPDVSPAGAVQPVSKCETDECHQYEENALHRLFILPCFCGLRKVFATAAGAMLHSLCRPGISSCKYFHTGCEFRS